MEIRVGKVGQADRRSATLRRARPKKRFSEHHCDAPADSFQAIVSAFFNVVRRVSPLTLQATLSRLNPEPFDAGESICSAPNGAPGPELNRCLARAGRGERPVCRYCGIGAFDRWQAAFLPTPSSVPVPIRAMMRVPEEYGMIFALEEA